MNAFLIAWRYFKSRRLNSIVTIFFVALGVTLIVSILGVMRGALAGIEREEFPAEVIVGQAVSPIALTVSSLYGIGAPPEPMTHELEQRVNADPRVAAAVPLRFGSHYQDHWLVGTTRAFFGQTDSGENPFFRIQEGAWFSNEWEAVLGSETARSLNLEVGDPFSAHPFDGSVEGEQRHRQNPFQVVGILRESHTAFDRMILVSIGSVEELHSLPRDVAADTESPVEAVSFAETGAVSGTISIQPKGTAAVLFVTLFDPRQATGFAAELNQQENAAAVDPQRVVEFLLSRLDRWWRIFLAVAMVVVAVAVMTVLTSVFGAVSEWRRDIAVMRALGARPMAILWIALFESLFLSASGSVAGWTAGRTVVYGVSAYLSRTSAVIVLPFQFSAAEFMILIAIIGLSGIAGLIPAYKAFRLDVVNTLRG